MGERRVAQPRAGRSSHQDRQHPGPLRPPDARSGRERTRHARGRDDALAGQGNSAVDAPADLVGSPQSAPPMAAEEATPAIVLRTRDYMESDRIVTLLTEQAGKLGGIAKGAKASRRRFEHRLEPFSHVMLYFRRRPNGQLVFITRAEASPDLTPFAIEDDLTKIALGSYMLELADAFTSEEAEATGAYRVLVEALEAVSIGRATIALRQAYELRMLHWAGYGLDF